MNKIKYCSFIAGSVLALAIMSHAHAEGESEVWGDLGYAHPQAPEVEPIPESIASSTPEIMPAPIESEDVTAPPAAGMTAPATFPEDTIRPSKTSSKFTDINTVKNTYGVVTEERDELSLYVSPFGGVTSIFGNDTANVTPRYAFGASAGLLISSNMLLGVSYTYSEQGFSNPRVNTTQGVFVFGNTPVFNLKQNSIDAGVKLYILGRESRLRPFLGGGLGWSRGVLNYTPEYLSALGYQPQYVNDFTINQFDGYGELGAEFAFTRAIVANASFKLTGVIGSSTSGSNSTTAQNYDPSKLDVGNSVSRSAAYVIAGGLGIYF